MVQYDYCRHIHLFICPLCWIALSVIYADWMPFSIFCWSELYDLDGLVSGYLLIFETTV